MIINKMEENGQITGKEKRRLKGSIEKEGKPNEEKRNEMKSNKRISEIKNWRQ